MADKQSTPFTWRRASPDEVGMNAARLAAWQEDMVGHLSKALLVARHDHIVLEWYAPDHDRDKKHYTASLAKAMVGGLSLALAMDDGLIDLDDRAAVYIPSWQDDPLKSQITIRHLATHSSGLDDAKEGNIPHADLPGWKGAFWRQEPDPFSISLNQVPVMFTPGAAHLYSNPGMAVLAYTVTASLRKASHGYRDIRTLLKRRIMNKIGVKPEEWSIGYGKTFYLDGLPLVANWGGGAYTARATAAVGRLMMRKGDWDGQKIISSEVVGQMLTGGVPPADPKYTPCWYGNSDGRWPDVPRDAFWGHGAGKQMLFVVPSLDLILVRNGSDDGFDLREKLFAPLIAAVEGD
ncbi:MAG TPA: serine hydrolase [Firmicutes bacterium]|nr:serine hydrolase [Bacillota bacterium]